MNTVATKTKKESARQSEGMLLNFVRKLVLKKLESLSYGQLSLVENGREMTFGTGTYNCSAKIEIVDSSFYFDIFSQGSIGAAQAYVLKRWETPNLDNVMRLFAMNRTLLTELDSGIVNLIKPVRFIEYWRQRNTQEGSKRNIVAHYDLPDKLFELFLDESQMYSSAYYKTGTESLEEAQYEKLELIAKRLCLKRGESVLEIGTGWGALALHLAGKYGCHVTTTTISERQYEVSKRKIKEAGLEDRITLLKEDYRNLSGTYDRVVSIEMIEAVGKEFLGGYLKKISDVLKPEGLAVLQAITINDQEYDRAVDEVDFIKKFIFPGSFIPSLHAIMTEAKENTDLRLYEQSDFAEDYAKTLLEWKVRFNDSKASLAEIGLDEEFQRLWNFYFSYCIGGFKERAIGVSHLVFGKPFFRNQGE